MYSPLCRISKFFLNVYCCIFSQRPYFWVFKLLLDFKDQTLVLFQILASRYEWGWLKITVPCLRGFVGILIVCSSEEDKKNEATSQCAKIVPPGLQTHRESGLMQDVHGF